jgi:hypothetical protein
LLINTSSPLINVSILILISLVDKYSYAFIVCGNSHLFPPKVKICGSPALPAISPKSSHLPSSTLASGSQFLDKQSVHPDLGVSNFKVNFVLSVFFF